MIQFPLSVDCTALPDEVKKKLAECGFKMCADSKTTSKGKAIEQLPLWKSLTDLWNWTTGLPESFSQSQ